MCIFVIHASMPNQIMPCILEWCIFLNHAESNHALYFVMEGVQYKASLPISLWEGSNRE
jgi:hypothetical protein